MGPVKLTPQRIHDEVEAARGRIDVTLVDMRDVMQAIDAHRDTRGSWTGDVGRLLGLTVVLSAQLALLQEWYGLEAQAEITPSDTEDRS